MATDLEVYAKCMAQVQARLGVIEEVLSERVPIPHHDARTEMIFIQFRKSLEELAFASLTASKDAYAAAHAKYSVHWRANDMLTELDKINPSFYPIALEAPRKTQPGFFHFERLESGFMTRDEFAKLHKRSSEVLHVRNLHKEGDPTIDISYTVQEWVQRIRNLLHWHSVTLIDGNALVCNMPDGGLVHVHPGSAIPIVGESPAK